MTISHFFHRLLFQRFVAYIPQIDSEDWFCRDWRLSWAAASQVYLPIRHESCTEISQCTRKEALIAKACLWPFHISYVKLKVVQTISDAENLAYVMTMLDEHVISCIAFFLLFFLVFKIEIAILVLFLDVLEHVAVQVVFGVLCHLGTCHSWIVPENYLFISIYGVWLLCYIGTCVLVHAQITSSHDSTIHMLITISPLLDKILWSDIAPASTCRAIDSLLIRLLAFRGHLGHLVGTRRTRCLALASSQESTTISSLW